ncbi:MAG TPA: GNAT family N-acetyltransferase [Saprospiraceae bacterium]|nr:GNAT family N-acetyltransferase [Saprospiraceae bacterium]
MDLHTSIQCSPALAEEIPSLLDMMKTFCGLEHLHFDAEMRELLIQQMLNNEALGRLYNIKLDGKTAGYVALCFGFSFEYMGKDAFIDELFLMEEYRCHGYGKEVINIISEQSSLLGLKAIHLEVDHANRPAQNLYLNAGFAGKERHLWTKWL